MNLDLSLNLGSSNKAVSPLFTPASLSPTIWYDMEDADYAQIATGDSVFTNWSSVQKLVNKANPGTYDADQGASANKLLFNMRQLNNHGSIANRGNSYMQTYYFPKAGAFTFGCNVKLPSGTSLAHPMGVNDNNNRRFFIARETTGAITFGIGNTSFTTTTTYSISSVLTILAIGTGSSISVWINGVLEINAQAYTFTGTSSVSMLLHARTTGSAPTAYWNTGYLGDVVLLERAINTAEQANLQAYLTNKATDNIKLKIILLGGQSNNPGLNTGADYTDSSKEKPNFKIWQVTGVSASNENEVTPAWEPLKHRSTTTGGVGLGFAIAKAYLATQSDPNLRVLLVPAAMNSTGFSSGHWVRTSGSLYTNLVSKANLAMGVAADKELLFLAWQQGEADTGLLTQSQYQNFYLDMIAGLRTDITGAANLKVTVGEMVPNFAGGVIRTAIANLPNLDNKTSFVSSAGLTDKGDNLHFDAVSSRVMGQRHFSSYQLLP